MAFAVDFQHAIGERNAGLPQDRLIQYRMGMSIGDIVVEDDDIFGDGVNSAARLEALAKPGGICISAIVHEILSNPQIAERMFIARGTVKIHLAHIFDKLDVTSRTQLAAKAVAEGLAEVG